MDFTEESTSIDFKISIQNINQILKTLSYETDFIFVFHNQEFNTYKLVADLLSPAIAQIHKSDPTYNTYIFKNSDSKADLFDFTRILEMVDNPVYTIKSTEELQIFKEIFFELENEDVFSLFSNFQDEITKENVFERIKTKQSMNSSAYINDEIEFIAKNFYSLYTEDEVKSLPLDVIESILFNENLVLSNEDEVFNFITSYSIEKSVILEDEPFDANVDPIIPLSEIGVDFGYSSFNLNFLNEKFQNQQLSSIMISKEIFDKNFIPLLDSVIISNLSENALSIFLGLYNFHEMTNNIWEKVAMKILNIPISFQNKAKTRYSCMISKEKIKKNEKVFDPFAQNAIFNTNETDDSLLTLFPLNNNNNNANTNNNLFIDIF